VLSKTYNKNKNKVRRGQLLTPGSQLYIDRPWCSLEHKQSCRLSTSEDTTQSIMDQDKNRIILCSCLSTDKTQTLSKSQNSQRPPLIANTSYCLLFVYYSFIFTYILLDKLRNLFSRLFLFPDSIQPRSKPLILNTFPSHPTPTRVLPPTHWVCTFPSANGSKPKLSNSDVFLVSSGWKASLTTLCGKFTLEEARSPVC
jgi:hypothetical protein